jgi:hypothetical protein
MSDRSTDAGGAAAMYAHQYHKARGEIQRLREQNAKLVDALTEARNFVSSDYTGSRGRDLSGGVLARIDEALAGAKP